MLIVFVLWSCQQPNTTIPTEKVKVAWRTVGHQLLLAQQDTTSLVMPIEEESPYTYELRFQEELAIAPDSLAAIVERVFDKAAIPKYYIVEVKQCNTMEVAYSFQITQTTDTTLVPCKGRDLPKGCYTIAVTFEEPPKADNTMGLFIFVVGLVLIAVVGYFVYKKKQSLPVVSKDDDDDKAMRLGSFTFYPDELKLVKQAVEIKLSRKECELLALFIANSNKIITREELSKRIWEDNGVVVGRSLDTYVSKLRKKLKDDQHIQFVNVHGVGYKLEVSG